MASGFRPVKSRAKQFSYKPRFYSPEGEERERRREELTGRRLDIDQSDNMPGDMLRRQISARRGSRLERKSGSSMIFLVFGLAVLLLLAANLVPLISKWFSDDGTPKPTQIEREVQEFNPYAPITIVLNDYQQE